MRYPLRHAMVLSVLVGNWHSDCLTWWNSIVTLKLLDLLELLDSLDRLHAWLDKINRVGQWMVVLSRLALVTHGNRCHWHIHSRLLNLGVHQTILAGSLSAGRIVMDTQMSCQLV